MLISVEGTGKNQLEPGQRMLWFCNNVLCEEILDDNRPVCWSIVVKEKPTVDFPFFGALPSDRIPKATKDVSMHILIHSGNFCKLNLRIPGTFCSC
jgi:hypothetical protein